MVGTYIIGLAILVIWVDLVFMPRGGWRGFYALVVSPVYFFGLLLVVYSIHLIGNKWGWLNFPIAIVIFIVAIFIMLFSYAYRLAWFLAFPLNYVVLLIQFLTSINKDFNHWNGIFRTEIWTNNATRSLHMYYAYIRIRSWYCNGITFLNL